MGVLGRDPGQEKVGCKWAVGRLHCLLSGSLSLHHCCGSEIAHLEKNQLISPSHCLFKSPSCSSSEQGVVAFSHSTLQKCMLKQTS